jgi:hypothetical protein
MGGGLAGRGRETIYSIIDPDEIVRMFDGKDNPIGKSYTKKQFQDMLISSFHVDEMFLHFFPARALPINLNRRLHAYLDRNVGFMLFARVRKKQKVDHSV